MTLNQDLLKIEILSDYGISDCLNKQVCHMFLLNNKDSLQYLENLEVIL